MEVRADLTYANAVDVQQQPRRAAATVLAGVKCVGGKAVRRLHVGNLCRAEHRKQRQPQRQPQQPPQHLSANDVEHDRIGW